jgi:hypothetical protein
MDFFATINCGLLASSASGKKPRAMGSSTSQSQAAHQAWRVAADYEL